MNLSKTFAKEKEITTAPTTFSTAPNRYGTACLIDIHFMYTRPLEPGIVVFANLISI